MKDDMFAILMVGCFLITAISFSSLLIGLKQGDKCKFNTRASYYNPFYRAGCWLTETYYIPKQENAYHLFGE